VSVLSPQCFATAHLYPSQTGHRCAAPWSAPCVCRQCDSQPPWCPAATRWTRAALPISGNARRCSDSCVLCAGALASS
jgi:hypothetical protein